MTENEKEKVKQDFIEMIKKSWTYEKMIDCEKEQLKIVWNRTKIFGTKKQAYLLLHDVYFAFLIGLGYNPSLFNWREKENDLLF